MVRKLMAVAAIVLGGFAAAPLVAAAPRPAHPGAARPSRRHGPAAQPPRVACTVLGCMQIPPACEPVAGTTPSGRPTGYDVIICPPGLWPLK